MEVAEKMERKEEKVYFALQLVNLVDKEQY